MLSPNLDMLSLGVSPLPLENICPPPLPPIPSFWSVQVERSNMTARTENNEACKEYVEVRLSGGEEKRTCIHGYEYY